MRLILAFLLALSLFAGSRPAGKTATAAKPVSSAVRDAQVENNIRARFAKSKIARNNFQVRVQGGTATLDGQTDVIQHKGTATRLAKSGGASRVVNRIQVSQTARDKAARNLAKGRRRAQIKRSVPR